MRNLPAHRATSERRRVHQFLYSLGFRDAVGTHTLEMDRVFRRAGIRGAVWAEDIHPRMLRQARPADGYQGSLAARRSKNVFVYQASTGSRRIVNELLLSRREPTTIYYHNITPARFFEPWAPSDALNLAWGREELNLLAPRIRVAMANSEFSADELRALGIADVRVIPPYLPPTRDVPPNPDHARWLRTTKRGIDILSVSRIVPHKGHLHLIRAFAALRAAVDGNARLFLVGAWGPDEYMRALFRLRERLGLEGVVFTGSIAESTLAAHYREADVYLSLSEHEGFGLPLVEAMRHWVPVVAYDGGAVAETLGGSGVLLDTLDPTIVAEVVGRVSADAAMREQLIHGQLARVSALESFPRDKLILDAVIDAARQAVSTG